MLRGASRRKQRAVKASRFFRLAARSTIHASESEKSVFCLIPPCSVVGNSALTESKPQTRPSSVALCLMAVCNSRCFNFVAKLRLGTNLNQFLLEAFPFPAISEDLELFCAHAALRLSCRHVIYAPLWHEQLGDLWRESRPRDGVTFSSLLPSPRERQEVRASLDAVVAHSYGVKREQYQHILKASGHLRKLADWNERCLAAFDEIAELGLSVYLTHRDPYGDVSLVREFPREETH